MHKKHVRSADLTSLHNITWKTTGKYILFSN